jgi:hypothetical protein
MSIFKARRSRNIFIRIGAAALLIAATALPGSQFGTTLEAASPPALSPVIPGDAGVEKGGTTAAYDDFSWRAFVALNWPSNGNGPIGKGGDATPLWQSWKRDIDLLVPEGQTPLPWNAAAAVPAGCTGGGPDTRVLRSITKGGVLAGFLTPGSGPLIDQNGAYARFEILVNQAMYDFIRDNSLYTKAGQKSFMPGTALSFPRGAANPGAAGAIMVKAAWKVLGPGDDPSRFHTASAYILNEGREPVCTLAKVGLAGLHISHKTASAPQWVWSTFEHVDNAPTKDTARAGHYSFNNGKPDTAANWNVVPKGKWDPIDGDKTPVQVVRLKPVAAGTAALNATYTAALRQVDPRSVFANYQLVGTQFPKRPARPQGEPVPEMLANTTMETYLQKDVPPVSSNCMGCHFRATMSDGRESDFSFILSRVARAQ